MKKRRAPDTAESATAAPPFKGLSENDDNKHPRTSTTADGATATATADELAEADGSLAWRHCTEWIVANGGAVTSLAIGTGVNGLRGLHATQRIPRGTPVLRVPRRCVVTAAKVLASPVGTALGRLQKELHSEAMQHAPSDVLLALFLVLDRGHEGSFFAPYHATLPSCSDASSVSALPVNWQAEALGRLRGTKLFAAVERQREAIAADHALIVRCWAQCCSDPSVPAPSLEDFRWGLAMVSSRGFELDWPREEERDDEDQRAARPDPPRAQDQQRVSRPRLGEIAAGVVGMVPIFDLGNHKRPRDVSYSTSTSTSSSSSTTTSTSSTSTSTSSTSTSTSSSDSAAMQKIPTGALSCDGEVVVTTLRDIDVGEEVCMTYGAQPNAKLLQDYGFVTLPNIEPDGSSNDTLKLSYHRSASVDDVDGPAELEVEVELRMAVETSYTYFPFLKAIDFHITDSIECDVDGVQGTSDAGQEDAQLETQADGDTGMTDDFEAFEAAMASMESDNDIDEDDYDRDLDDEATDELYGSGAASEDGSSPATATTAAGSKTPFAGGEVGTVVTRVASALPKLIAKLEALQAAYHTATGVDGAKSQLFRAHASMQAQRQGQRDDGTVSNSSVASGAAVAAAVIVLVEQCTLDFFIAAAKKALLVLVHDVPCDAMIALRNRAKQEEQDQQHGDEETRQHHPNSMEYQVCQLSRLCRGVGSTRLALALLQLRCGMGSSNE
jgi:hypothetical protein